MEIYGTPCIKEKKTLREGPNIKESSKFHTKMEELYISKVQRQKYKTVKQIKHKQNAKDACFRETKYSFTSD